MTFKKKIACLLSAATIVSAAAAPATALPTIQSSSDLMRAQTGLVKEIKHRWRHGYYRRGNRYYYNGYRGYRARRPGYRYYNGWWFPGAAFALGAIIGQGLATPAPAAPGYGLPVAHYRWCEAKYRSYWPQNNTFQPYHGPRRACVSPYWP